MQMTFPGDGANHVFFRSKKILLTKFAGPEHPAVHLEHAITPEGGRSCIFVSVSPGFSDLKQ
jgi:hypothetical protein